MLLNSFFEVKIADFGFATNLPISSNNVGSKHYRAPEVKLGVPYSNEKVDVFACGTIMFVMLFCTYPFKIDADKNDVLFKLIDQKRFEEFWKFQQNKY